MHLGNEKRYHVYILSSKSGTLYIGMTNNLRRRVWEHKHKIVIGFTQKYNVNRLVYFEEYREPQQAIAREKQLKGRKRKITLIESLNPKWRDLSEDWNE